LGSVIDSAKEGFQERRGGGNENTEMKMKEREWGTADLSFPIP
jgi:hypothetical protein